METLSGAITGTYDANVLVIGGCLAGLSVADRLADKGEVEGRVLRSQAARNLFDAAVRVIMSAEPSELSLLHFLFYLNSGGGLAYLAESHNGAQQRRFVPGAQELSTRLAARLGDRVVLNAEVLAIEQDVNGATVRTRTRAYRTRYAISTVPPVPARHITYAPMLPPLALRDQLMERMPMGATTKAIAVYDEPFWRSEGCSGEAVSTAGPVTATFDNTSHDGTQPALMGFVVGKHARQMSRLTPPEQRQAVLAAFERFFGLKAAKPASFYIKDWQLEEFTGGCYVASMAPGAMTRSGTALRAWAGRLGFAGTETATRWNGYMAGALESAGRVVDEVVKKLSGHPEASA